MGDRGRGSRAPGGLLLRGAEIRPRRPSTGGPPRSYSQGGAEIVEEGVSGRGEGSSLPPSPRPHNGGSPRLGGGEGERPHAAYISRHWGTRILGSQRTALSGGGDTIGYKSHPLLVAGRLLPAETRSPLPGDCSPPDYRKIVGSEIVGGIASYLPA